MKKATAKSLAKTAVLDASDKPEDQDEARKRRVKMDFASWRKQTKAGKTTHQEEVGISSAAAMEKARQEAKLRKKEQDAVRKEKEALKKEEVQVDEVYKKLPVAKMAKKISDKSFKSGQSGVSTKSAEQTGKMIGVLDTHDPERSKAKSKLKEAKVDQGLDDEGKEDARNYRKFGTKHNQHKTAVLRRALHRSRRGDKKVKGQKEVQERTLDTFEKNKKEEIVKGMKKDTKGFKKRYGTEWKSVMYATATKQAKKAGDTSKSDERYASEETKMPGVSDKDKTYIKQRGKNLFKKDLKGTIPEGRMDKDPPPQFEKGDDDRGNPAYMKSVSYSDEEKWKRLQKMRKASKKKEVRAKAVDESATNPKKFSMKKFARGLEKQYGKGSVISKYTEKPKPQPQKKREPKKDTRSPEQKKADQHKANMDAVYGRTPWNKEGSLGT